MTETRTTQNNAVANDDSRAVQPTYEERKAAVAAALAVQANELVNASNLVVGHPEYVAAARKAAVEFDNLVSAKAKTDTALAAIRQANTLTKLWKMNDQGKLVTGYEVLSKGIKWLQGQGEMSHGQMRFIVKLVAFVAASDDTCLPSKGELNSI